MPTCCLRGGCFRSPTNFRASKLSYLVKCNFEGREYKVFGYKGKQVRDNLVHQDVAAFMVRFLSESAAASPEVYNLGGGEGNHARFSKHPRVSRVNCRANSKLYSYVDEARAGDHIVYYSDLRKMKWHFYPAWASTEELGAKHCAKSSMRGGND